MFLRLQPSVIPAFIRAVFRIAVEVLDRFCRNGLLGNKIEAIFVSFFAQKIKYERKYRISKEV